MYGTDDPIADLTERLALAAMELHIGLTPGASVDLKTKKKKERDDAPWWNPFAPRTLWCPETLGEDHVCDRPDVHWQHTCVCGFRWAA